MNAGASSEENKNRTKKSDKNAGVSSANNDSQIRKITANSGGKSQKKGKPGRKLMKETSSTPGSTESNEYSRDKEQNSSQEFESNKEVRQIPGNEDSRSHPNSDHFEGDDSQYDDDESYQNSRFSEDRRDSSEYFASSSGGFRLPSGLTGGFGAQLGGRRSMNSQQSQFFPLNRSNKGLSIDRTRYGHGDYQSGESSNYDSQSCDITSQLILMNNRLVEALTRTSSCGQSSSQERYDQYDNCYSNRPLSYPVPSASGNKGDVVTSQPRSNPNSFQDIVNEDRGDDDYFSEHGQAPPSVDESVSTGRAFNIPKEVLVHDAEGESVFNEDSGEVRKISAKFATSRISPIISAVAQLLNLEADSDTELECEPSLAFGDLDNVSRNQAPMIRMPNELASLSSKIRKVDKSISQPNVAVRSVLTKAFRVSREDYDSFFSIPRMDDDILPLIKDPPSAKPAYSKTLDRSLSGLDSYSKLIQRLSAFQLTILNALLIDYQPLDSDLNTDSTFHLEAIKLVTDLSAQQLRLAAYLSHAITQQRRANVCDGLKGRFIDPLINSLQKAPANKDPTKLFGGQFKKIAKTEAKFRASEDSVQKLSSQQSSSTSSYNQKGSFSQRGAYNQRGNNFRGKQSSNFQQRGKGSRSSDRGQKRSYADSGRDNNGSSSAKRGRGAFRGQASRRF